MTVLRDAPSSDTGFGDNRPGKISWGWPWSKSRHVWAHSSQLSTPLPHLPAVWMLWGYFCSSQDRRWVGLALAALRIAEVRWPKLTTLGSAQDSALRPSRHFPSPPCHALPWPSCKAHCSRLCEKHSTNLLSSFSWSDSQTRRYYSHFPSQQILFYKNNNPSLSQKNNVSLSHCN